MIKYIQVDQGPVDINDLRARYLGGIKTCEGVMLPKFAHADKEYFITDINPLPNDMWLIVLTNEDGLITRIRVRSGELTSDGRCLMMEDDYRVYTPKKYYDYWVLDGGKPSPFFFESTLYHVKSFTRIPGSTELYIVAEREAGHWYTFQLTDDLKSTFTRVAMHNEKGHKKYDWILENAKWAFEQRRYF